jgi:tetratricopeptide (TPR) repeat protein
MDICEKYLQDARKALKSSMFSKPDPIEAMRSYEGAAQCFENARQYDKAAECYLETANMLIDKEPLKAAEVIEKAAACSARSRGPAKEYYLKAAEVFREFAVKQYRQSPDKGLQLLQRAAEDYEKAGDSKKAIQCYEVGAEASLKRGDFLNAIVFYGIAGQHFERRKEYKKAVKYYHQVAKLWDKQNVPENVAENYSRMASSLNIIGENEYASQFSIKAAEKYKQAGETYKSAKAYESAAQTQEAEGKFKKSAELYSKSAEIIHSLKNMDKYGELYEKTAENYLKAGDVQQSVDTRMMLAEAFADDPYRCSKQFEKAVDSVENDPDLKLSLLKKQGEVLLEMHDYLKAARSLKQAAELTENMGESAADIYKRAGEAFVQYVKSMKKVKNQSMAQEGQKQAVLCFEKAGMSEKAQEIREDVVPDTGKRQKQIREELNQLKKDFDNGLLSPIHYRQMKEGYDELLRNITQ